MSARQPRAAALVVEPQTHEAHAFLSVLTQCGFEVTVAATFAQARERLSSRVQDLLLTAVRLGEYNGLQLVLRATSIRADTACIVVSDLPDSGLERDATALGATFIIKPISERDLMAAVLRTLAARRLPPGERAAIRPPFERRSGQRRSMMILVGNDRRVADRRRALAQILGFPIGGRPAW